MTSDDTSPAGHIASGRKAPSADEHLTETPHIARDQHLASDAHLTGESPLEEHAHLAGHGHGADHESPASSAAIPLNPQDYITDDSETEFTIVSETETETGQRRRQRHALADDLSVPEASEDEAMTSEELREAAEALFGPAVDPDESRAAGKPPAGQAPSGDRRK